MTTSHNRRSVKNGLTWITSTATADLEARMPWSLTKKQMVDIDSAFTWLRTALQEREELHRLLRLALKYAPTNAALELCEPKWEHDARRAVEDSE